MAHEPKVFRLSHRCTLGRLHGINERKIPPQASRYQKWWFNFREFCTIHKDIHSRRRFRSNASVLKEKLRHLNWDEYRFIIHPFSRFVRYKDFFIMYIWFILFLMDPYLASFCVLTYFAPQGNFQVWVRSFSWTLNLLLFFDIVIRFFTGFVIRKTGEIVLKPKVIVRHYLKTYFIIDCLPVMSTFILFILRTNNASLKILIVLIQMKNLRLLRLPCLIYNLKLLLRLIFVRYAAASTLAFIAIIGLFFIHWWTCLVGLVHIIREVYGFSGKYSWIITYNEEIHSLKVIHSIDKFDDSITYYIVHLQIVLCHFYGAGVGRYQTTDPYERIIFSLIIMSGLVYNIVALAHILQIFGTVNISEVKFEEFEYQVQEYMNKNQVSKKLKRRINKYLDYKYNKQFFSENIILNYLSEHLRMEVLLYSCQNLMEHVQILKGLSRPAVGTILALLEQEIFLPRDPVMSTEHDKGKLFFILYGTCQVNVIGGPEIAHVEDGHQFGELQIYDDEIPLFYKVMAAEISEVYSLTEANLHYCCKHHPEIIPKLTTTIDRDRNRYFRQLTAIGHEVDTSDIITELRRGKIILHGRMREEL